MKIIEIEALSNGAHRNQDGALEIVPSGWAVIPDDMPIPETFPFVNIEVQAVEHTRESIIPDTEPEIFTVPTVTAMTAGIIPEPQPKPEPEPTVEDCIAELEEQIAQADEIAITLYEEQEKWEAINSQQDEALMEIYEMIIQ